MYPLKPLRFSWVAVIAGTALLIGATGCEQRAPQSPPEPAQPTEPAKPAEPAQPAEPAEATEPTQPGEPTQPAEMAEPPVVEQEKTDEPTAVESEPAADKAPTEQASTEKNEQSPEEAERARLAAQIYEQIAAMKAEMEKEGQIHKGPLAQELNAIAEASSARISAENKAVMKSGIEEVAQSDLIEKMVGLDDKAPAFELPSTTGETTKLSDLIAEGPLVLIFYRGGWCPYCNATLKAYNKHLRDFKAAGANVVAIAPEIPDKAAQTAATQKIDFPILSDVGNQVAEAYGLVFKLGPDLAKVYDQFLNLSEYNGDDSYTLPLSATYIIDTQGVVRYVFADPDYRKRAEPVDVYLEVNKLNLAAE